MQHYTEEEVIPQGSGTVVVSIGLGMSGSLKAYMAIKKGRQDWEPVSGEIKQGGGPTVARRPPTVQEAAGADAQGKLVALANARFEKGRIGRQALVVDYVLQKQPEPGKSYFIIIEGGDRPIVTRFRLMRPVVGKKDQISLSSIGPGGFPDGTLRVHIEERRGMSTAAGAVTVSNTVTVKR